MINKTKRKEVETKLKAELKGICKYKKVQVVEYQDNTDYERENETIVKHAIGEIVINIVDDWDYRELAIIRFLDGKLSYVEGQVDGDTLRALEKIINES
jgi:hypothetical protein